jgi:hypothetical protein
VPLLLLRASEVQTLAQPLCLSITFCRMVLSNSLDSPTRDTYNAMLVLYCSLIFLLALGLLIYINITPQASLAVLCFSFKKIYKVKK